MTETEYQTLSAENLAFNISPQVSAAPEPVAASTSLPIAVIPVQAPAQVEAIPSAQVEDQLGQQSSPQPQPQPQPQPLSQSQPQPQPHQQQSVESTMFREANGARCSEVRPTVYALCSLHCKRNSQLKGVHANAQFNRLARAATQQEFDYRFNQIRSTASSFTCEYILAHKDEFSYMGLSTRQGLQTNYGQVSTNPVEQCNAHMKTLRSSGPVTLCRELLSSLASLYARRYKQAYDVKFVEHKMVVPAILKIVKSHSDTMLKGKWCNSVVSFKKISSGQSTDTKYHMLSYIVRKDTQQFNVSLISNPDPALQWYNRVICSCSWTLEIGHPCKHASFCLIHPQIVDEFKKIQNSQSFQYDLSMWYSPVYHTATMLEQYNQVVKIPTIFELKCYRIYPPRIYKPAGFKSNFYIYI